MKQLWAPWRMTYVTGEDREESAGCIFCLNESRDEDRTRLILHRGEHAFVVMNKYPYTNGHLMVVPYRHCSSPDVLNEAEVLEMHRLLVLCRKVLEEAITPDGFNVGMNLGRAAGAGIEDHLHLHIVPRWKGDTNFMPVFAEVRVIPQHLEATYDILHRAFSGRLP
jgi:ATP adenylyltransferase